MTILNTMTGKDGEDIVDLYQGATTEVEGKLVNSNSIFDSIE